MKILTFLSPSWTGELALLKQHLTLGGIPCEELSADDLPGLTSAAQPEGKEDILILTDSEEVGKTLTQAKIPWAGCGREVWFEGAPLVLESLEGIDGRYLYEWMRREQGLPAPIAQTERLTIREITEADIEDLIRIYRQTDPGPGEPSGRQTDPGTGAPSSGGRPGADTFTKEGLTAYIHTAYRLQGYGLWSVLYGDTLIGCCGFAPCEKEALELQYMLDPAYQRQGFGTEMCRAAIAYAKERLGITGIRVRIDPDNRASRALADKLGLSAAPAKDS